MSKYIEEQWLILPRLKNGVMEFGDLWDCHQNTAVGLQLFSSDLNSLDISVNPLATSSYDVTHTKGTEDKANELFLQGEIKAGILGGLLQIGVGLTFDKATARKFDEEEFLLTYRQETFLLKLNSSARSKINQSVLDDLLDGKIKASHVVSELILGGEATSTLNFSELHTKDKLKLGGSITGTIDIVIASATVTASAGMTANEKIDEFKTRISLQSVPPLKDKPRTLSELIRAVNTLPGLISKEQHFSRLFPHSNIYGVPIKFRLVPIHHFVVEFSGSKLYRQMSEDIMNQLVNMLATIKDILDTDYVKTKVFQKCPQLLQILNDPQSELCKLISKKQSFLKGKCALFQTAATTCLKNLAYGKTKSSDILQLTQKFEKQTNFKGLDVKIEEFVTKGKLDYHAMGLKEPSKNFSYLMNKESLFDWWIFGTEIKLLLTTNSENYETNEILSFLERISEPLTKQGIKIGVAATSISDNFSLALKIGDKEYKYNGHKEIHFALQVIAVSLGDPDSSVASTFFNVASSFFGVRLPFTETGQFADLGNLISALEDICSGVVICETPLRLREEIIKDVKEKYKLVFLTDCVLSQVDSFQCFKTVKELNAISEIDSSSIIIGSLQQRQFSEGPLAIVFKNGSIFALCLDKLDVFVFVEFLKSNSKELLQLVSLENLQGNFSLYPERVRSALIIAELFDESVPGISTVELVNTVEDQKGQHLRSAITIMETIVQNDYPMTLSALAEISLSNFPDLIPVFKKFSWMESSKLFSAKIENSENWQQLHWAVNNFLMTNNPVLAKVNIALESLRHCLVTMEEIINNIIDDTSCPEVLSVKLKAAENVSINNANPKEKVISILKIFYQKEMKTENKSSDLKNFLQKVKDTIAKMESLATREKESEIMKTLAKKSVTGVISEDEFPTALKSKIVDLEKLGFEIFISNSIRAFEFYKDLIFEQDEYFYLISFQMFLKNVSSTSKPNSKFLSRFLVQIVNRIDPQYFSYPRDKGNVEKYICRDNYVQALDLLFKSSYNKPERQILEKFQQLNGISGEEFLVNFIRTAPKALEHPKLWKCSKFLLLLKNGLKIEHVRSEFFNACKNIKDYKIVPQEFLNVYQTQNSFQTAIESLGKLNEKMIWKNLDDFLQDLQRFSVRNVVPRKLCHVIRQSILHSPNFFEELEISNSLFYWDEEAKCFSEPWDNETICQAIINIMKWMDGQEHTENKTMKPHFITNEPISQNHQDNKPFFGRWAALNNWKPNFHDFRPLTHKPSIQSMKSQKHLRHHLQHFIDVLQVSSQECIITNTDTEVLTGLFHFPDEQNCLQPSYAEIISSILNFHNDAIALNQVLSSLSMCNKPLPLIIPHFRDNQKSFFETFQILHKVPITISNSQERFLFENQCNYICALQVGNFEGPLTPINILNSILKPPSQFFNEKHDILGFTELQPLTTEICVDKFWQNSNIESRNTPILITVHGNCLEITEILAFLKTISTGTILFFPPVDISEMEQNIRKLVPFLNTRKCVFGVHIDTMGDKASENFVFKSEDTFHHIQTKMSSLIHEILKPMKNNIGSNSARLSYNFLCKTIQSMPSIVTTASMGLIQIMQKISCRTAKQLLLKCDQQSRVFQEIISQAVGVFTSKRLILVQALAHLEFEINLLLQKEEKSILQSNSCKQKSVNKDEEITTIGKDNENLWKNFKESRITLLDFIKAFDMVLSDGPKMTCLENFAHYILESGGDVDINFDDKLVVEEIFEQIGKLSATSIFNVVTIFGDEDPTLVNSIFGTSNISPQVHPTETNDLSFRIVKLNNPFCHAYDKASISKYLIVFSCQIPSENLLKEKKKRLKFLTLLLSMSHLVMLNVDVPDFNTVSTLFEIPFLKSCKLNSKINPEFILITTNDSFQRTQDFKHQLWNTVQRVSEVSNNYKFDLGILHNPLDKYAHIPGAPTFEIQKIGNRVDYDGVKKLRNYIFTSAENINETETIDFSTWSKLFFENWLNLENALFEFNSCKAISNHFETLSQLEEFKNSVDAAFNFHRKAIQNIIEKDSPDKQKLLTENNIRSHLRETMKNCHNSECTECKKTISLQDKLSKFKDLNSNILDYIKNIKETSFQQLWQFNSVKMWKDALKNNESVRKNEDSKQLLKAYSLRHFVSSKRRFISEVMVEYNEASQWIIKDLALGHVATLDNIDACFVSSSGTTEVISLEKRNWLEKEIEDAVKSVYSQSSETICQIGMVRRLKKYVCKILEQFTEFSGDLLLDSQWTVHLFALRSLLHSAEIKQTIWNGENDAVTFLHSINN